MKGMSILFAWIFFNTATLKAQRITNVTVELPLEFSQKQSASKQLKTARFFTTTGYLLTGLGGVLWLAESALHQGEGRARTAPYIVMTTVGVGSLILGYSLKSKALRNNDVLIYITPEQSDIILVKKDVTPFLPAIKLKVSL